MCMRYVLSFFCADSPSFLSLQGPEMEFEDLWNAAKQAIDAFLVGVEPGDRTYKMLRRNPRRDR